jgi:anti-sigma B factor antagonist
MRDERKPTHLYLVDANLGIVAVRACGSSLSGGSDGAPLLRVDRRRVGHRVVVTAVGEVDLSSTTELVEAIDAARESGASEIWLDFTGTTFMGCVGLRAVLEAHDRLIEEERRLVLLCPPGPVLRLLTLTGVDRVLEIHPTGTAAQ